MFRLIKSLWSKPQPDHHLISTTVLTQYLRYARKWCLVFGIHHGIDITILSTSLPSLPLFSSCLNSSMVKYYDNFAHIYSFIDVWVQLLVKSNIFYTFLNNFFFLYCFLAPKIKLFLGAWKSFKILGWKKRLPMPGFEPTMFKRNINELSTTPLSYWDMMENEPNSRNIILSSSPCQLLGGFQNPGAYLRSRVRLLIMVCRRVLQIWLQSRKKIAKIV